MTNLASWMPLALFAVSVLLTTVGGNDKAPYLVLLSGVISAIVAIAFVVIGIASQKLALHLKNSLISAVPLILLLTIFVLARYGLVDPQKIVGFR